MTFLNQFNITLGQRLCSLESVCVPCSVFLLLLCEISFHHNLSCSFAPQNSLLVFKVSFHLKELYKVIKWHLRCYAPYLSNTEFGSDVPSFGSYFCLLHRGVLQGPEIVVTPFFLPSPKDLNIRSPIVLDSSV